VNKVHEIFPLIVYQGSVEGHDNFKENNLESLKDYWFNGYKNESPEFSGKIFAHKIPEYSDFFISLRKNINEYMDHLSLDFSKLSYHIIKSWVGCHFGDETPSITPHYHNESNISFVYYVSSNETSDKFCVVQEKNRNEVAGGIFETAKTRNIIKEYNRYNCNYYTITPTEGTVLLFPSNLHHFIQKVVETRVGDRVVIAGDIRITLSENNSDHHQGSTHPSQWLEL
jgi:uncharacterized protein (TIGR02466 family)